MTLTHQFELERARRELKNCSDVERLRSISLRMLDLMEAQQRWIHQQVEQGWFNR